MILLLPFISSLAKMLRCFFLLFINFITYLLLNLSFNVDLKNYISYDIVILNSFFLSKIFIFF